ncbi:hypothetical protein AALP_AA2G252500, partial [Arabis alpina]
MLRSRTCCVNISLHVERSGKSVSWSREHLWYLLDKALELSGSNIGKRKIVVKCHGTPPRFTVHDRPRPMRLKRGGPILN